MASRNQPEGRFGAEIFDSRRLGVLPATNGLFVEAADFSRAARSTADRPSKRIALHDGLLPAKPMIRCDIGGQAEDVVYIKTLDEDFFD